MMNTAPLGYRFAAMHAGIRKDPRDDLALIVSDRPASAAAVFTTNLVQAAPVALSRRHLRQSASRMRAILVNAGNANCATRTGDAVAVASCRAVASALRIGRSQVLPASTGVIGVELPGELLTASVPALVRDLDPGQFEKVASAIMTTDTRVKIATEQVTCAAGMVRIAGMCKGAGMIQPSMATTLAFVLTDADLAPCDLGRMLRRSIPSSFASLSIDGDMSTNDTVAVLANGASRVKLTARERGAVEDALRRVLESLAEQIAADGEGARKLIVIHTSGFANDSQARTAARAIANSPLVKTAIGGNDPNWGRILSAAGAAGVRFRPDRAAIDLQGTPVCRGGLAVPVNEDNLKRRLDESRVEVHLRIDRGGPGYARFFTCDLTEDYIRINGSYRT